MIPKINCLSRPVGQAAIYDTALTNLFLGNNITNLGQFALGGNQNLTAVYFLGNAPSKGINPFFSDIRATYYYLPGTSGWGTFSYSPLVPWYLPGPLILNFEPSFGIHNLQFGFTISWATNASVVVQICTNFANQSWIPIATNALSSGTNYFNDPQLPSYPCCFYRVSGP